MTHRSGNSARVAGLITALSLVTAACGGGSATAAPATAAPATAAPGTASPAADGLVVKALRNDAPKKFEFRAQIFVRGNIWSDGLEVGFKQAGPDFGVNMEIGGPMTVDATAQVAELESWIVQKVDCIMITAAAPAALTPSINKAVAAGIPVVTLDSDAPDSNRNVFVAGADSMALADAQIDSLARQMGEKGEWAFVIGQATQVEKMAQLTEMKARAAAKYPGMTFLDMQESNDDTQKAADIAQALIVAHPNIGGIISNSGAGTIGVAQGIKAAGKSGIVKVTGLTFATQAKQYIDDGTMPEVFLWNVQEQGYISTSLCYNLVTGKDVSTGTPMKVWTGKEVPAFLEPSSSNEKAIVAVQGPPLKIDKTNVNDLKP